MEGKDYIGMRFGRLTITSFEGPSKVTAVCDCGGVWLGRIYPLRNEETRSCGCLLKEARRSAGRANKKHGMDGTPEYIAWTAMRSRCRDPKHKSFHNYGGRGITVCSDWDEDFQAFFRDMGPRPGPGFSLDRIDNNLGYSKGNCRWATRSEQANNVRRNRVYVFMGEGLTISEAAQRFGIKYSTLKRRLDAGEAPDAAVQAPVRAWTRQKIAVAGS